MVARTRVWRYGASLIEMLVVISIIGLLAGLALSAVQTAREAARRLQCQNNLKQLGDALQQFQSIYNVFPPAAPGRRLRDGSTMGPHSFSPLFEVLPYLEQSSIYNSANQSIDFGDNCFIPQNQTAYLSRIAGFICPSESSSILRGREGPNNYRGNVGPSPYFWDSDLVKDPASYPGGGGGAFTFLHTIGPRNFTDGLANTAMIGEKVMGSNDQARFDGFRDFWCLGWPGPPYPASQSLVPLCEAVTAPNPPHVSSAGASWFCSGFRLTLYNHVVVPNWNGPSCKVDECDPFPDSSNDHGGVYGASSAHPGGVNCLFGDASVRYVKDSISLMVWRALSTRAGGEAMGSSGY